MMPGGFPGGSVVKNPLANARDAGSISRLRTIPWRRKRQPTPVSLPGKSHGRRSMVGYSPWGRKELDMEYDAPTISGRELCPCRVS